MHVRPSVTNTLKYTGQRIPKSFGWHHYCYLIIVILLYYVFTKMNVLAHIENTCSIYMNCTLLQTTKSKITFINVYIELLFSMLCLRKIKYLLLLEKICIYWTLVYNAVSERNKIFTVVTKTMYILNSCLQCSVWEK